MRISLKFLLTLRPYRSNNSLQKLFMNIFFILKLVIGRLTLTIAYYAKHNRTYSPQIIVMLFFQNISVTKHQQIVGKQDGI